jgi:hypothetical protein
VSIYFFPVAETQTHTHTHTQSFGNGANEDVEMQKDFED